MGAPLLKSQLVANDFYPPLAAPEHTLTSLPPRVIPFVRLPDDMPSPRGGFSLAMTIAAIGMAGIVVLLAAMVGAMFWFTHDTRIAATTVPVVSAPVIQPEESPQEKALAPTKTAPSPVVTEDPADITLPADGLNPPQPLPPPAVVVAAADAPPKSLAPKASNLQITMRAAPPEKSARDIPATAATLAIEAQGLAKQDKFIAAIALLTRAAQMDPDNLLYRLDLAVLYDRNGQKAEALPLYRQVLQAVEEGGLQEGASPLPPETLTAIHTRVDYMDGLAGE